MALCVLIDSAGSLVPTSQPVDQCTGYVMVSGSEYGVYSVLHEALKPPADIAQLSQWFTAPMAAIVFCYIIARVAGTVAGMFK
jgi:hypothetical protein